MKVQDAGNYRLYSQRERDDYGKGPDWKEHDQFWKFGNGWSYIGPADQVKHKPSMMSWMAWDVLVERARRDYDAQTVPSLYPDNACGESPLQRTMSTMHRAEAMRGLQEFVTGSHLQSVTDRKEQEALAKEKSNMKFLFIVYIIDRSEAQSSLERVQEFQLVESSVEAARVRAILLAGIEASDLDKYQIHSAKVVEVAPLETKVGSTGEASAKTA